MRTYISFPLTWNPLVNRLTKNSSSSQCLSLDHMQPDKQTVGPKTEHISKVNMPWISWQWASLFQFYPVSDGSCSEVIWGEKWLLNGAGRCKLGFIYQSLTLTILLYSHSEIGNGGTIRYPLRLCDLLFQQGFIQSFFAWVSHYSYWFWPEINHMH